MLIIPQSAPICGAFSNSTTVDVNRDYGVKPGDDVSMLLQTLLNNMTPGVSLDIIFSQPSSVDNPYWINGIGGTQATPVLQRGTTHVTVGDAGNVDRPYNCLLTLPALAWRLGTSTPLRIRGMCCPAYGDPANGGVAGVVLRTNNNVAGSYMFSALPQWSEWGAGLAWTGIHPYFENLVFYAPNDPKCGILDLETCIKAQVTKCVFAQGLRLTTSAPSGSTEAIMLPQTQNNGQLVVRDVQIRGWGRGIRISEHGVFDNINISSCTTAFTATGGGHVNWFGYVDCEEVSTLFKILNTAVVLNVNGFLDTENVVAPYMPFVFSDIPAASGISGELSIAGSSSGGYGLTGAGACNIVFSDGMKPRRYSHPWDNFLRFNSGLLPSGQAPGLSYPTFDAWSVLNSTLAIMGTWTASKLCIVNQVVRNGGNSYKCVTAGTSAASGGPTGTGASIADGSVVWAYVSAVGAASGLVSTATAAYAVLPVRDGGIGGRSRRVQCAVTIPAANGYVELVANRPVGGTSNAFWMNIHAGNLYCGFGAPPTGGLLTTISGVAGGPASYTLAIDVITVGGVAVVAKYYLNGVLQYEITLTSGQQYGAGTSDPFLQDGIYFVDTGVSVVTDFRVIPLAHAPANLTSGTATLVAGAATIANISITASSTIRLTRQTVGGTPGHLSVALTAGTGFAINSSSNTETSTVFWEIVSA